MKFIQILKSIFTIKFSKKDTLLTVMSVLFSTLFDKLTKQYTLFRVMFKYLSIFRKWMFHISIFSLLYSALAHIFTFKYDYRFFVSFTYGLILLGGEMISDYSDSIFNAWYKLLSKIGSKVEDHSSDNSLIDPKSVEQLKQIGEDKVVKGEPHSYSMKRTYIKSDEEYSMFTDWKVWLTGLVIAVGIITAIHVYGVEIGPLKDSIKDHSQSLLERIKRYFFGGGPGDDNSSNSSIDESRKYLDEFKKEADIKTQEQAEILSQRQLDKSSEIPQAPEAKVWGESKREFTPEEIGVYIKDETSTSPSSSGTVTPTQSSSSNPSLVNIVSKSSEHIWNYESEAEKLLFWQDYDFTLGRLLNYCSQIKKLFDHNIEIEQLVGRNRAVIEMSRNEIEIITSAFTELWSDKLHRLSPRDRMEALVHIAQNDPSISEIPNKQLCKVVKRLIEK